MADSEPSPSTVPPAPIPTLPDQLTATGAPHVTYNYNFPPHPDIPKQPVTETVTPVSDPRPVTPPIDVQPPPPSVPPEPPSDQDNRDRPTIANLRAEAAAERVAARQARERAEAAERAIVEAREAVDTVRAEGESRAAAITQRYQQRIADSELRIAAQAAGIVDLDLLPLIDRTGVVVNENDEVAGISEAIDRFKSTKPSFFRDVSAQPTASPPVLPRSTGSPLAVPPPNPNPSPSNVRELSPADYRSRLRDERLKLRGHR